MLTQYLHKHHALGTAKPKPFFLVGFGQRLQAGHGPDYHNNNLLISGIVYYSKAQYRLDQVLSA